MIQQSHMHEQSIGTLLKELTDESRTLLRQEVALAKAEMSEKVSRVGRNVAFLVIGGAVAYAGVIVLLGAASIGLTVALANVMSEAIAAWLGPLIVGVVVALIGYGLIQKAISTLKRERLVPDKTIDSIRENTEWLKDQMKNTGNRMTQTDTAIH